MPREARATRTGKTLGGPGPHTLQRQRALAETIAHTLRNCGLTIEPGRVIGETLYRLPFKADLIVSAGQLRGHVGGLALVVRYQETSGSGDHKFPYLVAAIELAEMPVMLVLAGTGWSDAAIAWVTGVGVPNLVAVVTPNLTAEVSPLWTN